MSIRKQEGTIKAFKEPGVIKDGQPHEKWDKKQVVIEWQEKAKDKTFDKVLPLDVFGEKSKVSQKWAKYQNDFSVGDKVKVSFDVSGGSFKNKNGDEVYTVDCKLIGMEHTDKQTQSNTSSEMPDEGDDLPF
jgi:hypothetical protein